MAMEPPSQPVGLSEMPLEIKIKICEFLCDHCCEGWEALRQTTDMRITRTPLKNLCLTSKSLRDAAEPVLFHFYCGGGEFKRSGHSLTRLLEALLLKPELSRSVKSLSVDGSNECNVKRAKSFMDSLFGGATMEERTAQLEEAFRHNFIFAGAIMQRAKNIQELEFSTGQNCETMPMELVHLKELSIHSNFPEGVLSPRLLLPFLRNNPKLEKLTFSNFEDVGEYDSDAMANIKQLTLIRTTSVRFPTLRKLLDVMPNLQSFKFWNAAVDLFEGDNILRELLSQRNKLTSLTLDGILFSGNCVALKRLSKLETLDTTVFAPIMINNMDSFKLPSSLKRLVLRATDGEMHEFAKVIEALGHSLHRFPHLESVDVVLLIYIGWGMDPKWFDTSRWVGDAEELFRNANVHFSARTLYRDQDAMRRNILGRGWGKCVRGKRYTDPLLET